MLSKYRHHLSIVRDCIDKNQMVIRKMMSDNVLCDGASWETIKKKEQRDSEAVTSKTTHQEDMENVGINGNLYLA